ncbi:acetylornithine deacetylase [Rhizobium sp. L1K21]|uniref:acetylornithine deacetylase n=1 Tax=Rhizobium sp. L1K21 TaxID=2954933 RepID=UPI002093FB41|nr:acetylornithine deacetylase [Rhizobium sp. L1K21]MCO6187853.1 acetylornithine deacetylase [Rhizobium sp. L1K21]
MPDLSRIKPLLEKLIAFPTIAGQSNLDLIDWAQDLLTAAGFAVTIVPARDGPKAGLLARFGEGDGGTLFSAHTDVVPVDGQNWTTDPFALVERAGRYIGRGTTDMKGFIACVLALAETLRETPPAKPVMIGLSWDEELGCRGIPEMIGTVIPTLGKPDLCIVGEPTLMRPVLGHKGKASYRATFKGTPGHSAMAPYLTNALHGAADFILSLKNLQGALAETGAHDEAFDPPFSTVHAGVARGGVALNIVPDHAEVLFEIRHLAGETPDRILSGLVPQEGADIICTGQYPGLSGSADDPVVAGFLATLPDAHPATVAFGTEAGYFAGLGIPTVVCGPGTMDDGHQPDESIATDQLDRYYALIRDWVAR